jgi:hypothetical protein
MELEPLSLLLVYEVIEFSFFPKFANIMIKTINITKNNNNDELPKTNPCVLLFFVVSFSFNVGTPNTEL